MEVIMKSNNLLNDNKDSVEIVVIDKDIDVLCITAIDFPSGVMDAHEKLQAIIPLSKERRYFGLSRPENGIIVYRAATEELVKDKAEKFNCEPFIIKKGKYICITILDCMKEPQSIGKAFEKLISYSDIDHNGYCVEWYFSDKDVKCMVRLNEISQI
jgi:hypothetical protein